MEMGKGHTQASCRTQTAKLTQNPARRAAREETKARRGGGPSPGPERQHRRALGLASARPATRRRVVAGGANKDRSTQGPWQRLAPPPG